MKLKIKKTTQFEFKVPARKGFHGIEISIVKWNLNYQKRNKQYKRKRTKEWKEKEKKNKENKTKSGQESLHSRQFFETKIARKNRFIIYYISITN